MPWLTPEDIPEGEICRPLSIPADTAWMSFFSGALTELTKTYNWEQFGALSVEDTVQKMQEIVNDYFLGGCGNCETPGGYEIIRISSTGHVEQLVNDAWVEPTGDYYIPPPAARTGGTEQEQICLAAKNAANVMQQLYESLSDSWNGLLDEAEAMTALTALFIALVGFEVAPISFAVAAFFIGVFKIVYTALEYIIADLWDSNFTTAFTCLLIDCAQYDAGVITFDYDCYNQKMNAASDAYGLTAPQLRLYVQMGYLIYFIGGMDGLALAARTTAVTDSDCSFCSDEWCYAENLTVTQGEFIPAYGSAWSSGIGWERGCVSNFGVVALDLDLGGDYTLTNFSFEVDVVLGSDPGSVGVPYVIQVLNDSVVVGSAGGTTIGGTYFISWDGGPIAIDAVHIEVVCSRTVCDGQANGISFSARGSGPRPFDWTNNC